MDFKISELKKTNATIQSHLKNMTYNSFLVSNNDNLNRNVFFPEIEYQRENDITSTNLIKLKKGMVSGVLSDNVFNKIITISGEIKITFIQSNEVRIITPLNTQLIVPNAKYIIEVLEDSEIISIYKPIINKKIEILEKETIYNKELLQ